MKPLSLFRLLLALLALAHPVVSWALFGVGDVVFDPENVAQTINVLKAAQQQIDQLGSLLGVSTQQFDQLLGLSNAIGNAAESSSYASSATPAQLQISLNSIPGLENASLNALFNANGQLDIFMGVPPAQWTQSVQTPTDYYRNILINPAIDRIGGSVGMSNDEVAYTQWYAARSSEDQHNLATRAAVDLSDLLANDWLQDTQQRRVNLQGLSSANSSAGTKATQAQTLSDQQHAQAQLSGNTNAILLESAAQNANASEAAVRAAHAQTQLLQDRNDTQRAQDILRSDFEP